MSRANETVLKNCEIPSKGKRVDVKFDSRIQEIGKSLDGAREINCSEKIALPGGVDPHVHFRDFRESQKESWSSGSRAALSGGTTTVLEMPNNSPPTTNLEMLRRKSKKARGVPVNFGLFCGVSGENLNDLRELSEKSIGFKLYVGGSSKFFLEERSEIKRAMEEVAGTDKVLSVHLERTSRSNGEAAVLKEIRELGQEYSVKLHIAHVSKKESVKVLESMKREGINVSAEVCPHHLLFAEEEVEGSALFEVYPPIRSKKDKEALWDGLKSGVIDMVASDHAPHTLKDKESGARGLPGVETRVPLLLSQTEERKFLDTQKISRLSSLIPAKRFGLGGKGKIEEGFCADIAIFDRERKKLEPGEIKSKCGWSPYLGMRLNKCVATFLSGELVYNRGVEIE